MSVDYRALVNTLNPHCAGALKRAVGRCMAQQHYHVEIEHLLLELLGSPANDIAAVLARCGVEPVLVEQELARVLEGVRRGHVREPAFGMGLIALLQQAWLLCSLDLGLAQVRSAAILLALLEHEPSRATLIGAHSSLLRVGRDSLRASIAEWTAGSIETPPASGGAGTKVPASAAPGGPTPALDQFTQDLTADARAGRIDPIVGRDAEIRQVVDILLRRRQNNPILVGAPGVGKTAVVEGLARRIAEGDVPPPLRGVGLRVLDLALLQAGAGVKGEFEQRLKDVIEEVRKAAPPVILFIDEAHTLIGAGGAAGQGDAANLLKPALARGELRTLAATTWLEYKKYIEKDPALARRFQLVQVEEPGEAAAADMLRGIAVKLEQHHGVSILESAVHDAVKLTHRYLPGRQLPDKAISVLDTACARVALGQHDTPPQVEAARRRIAAGAEELARLRAEQATGAAHTEAIARLADELAALETGLGGLQARWEEERSAVQEILRLRGRIAGRAPVADPAEDDEDGAPDLLAAQLQRLEAGLEAIRQDDAMVPVCVDSKTVASVVAAWTGIPVGKMLADESHAVRTLQGRLAARVIGQDGALALIANRIKAYRAGLLDPGKPVGVFLLVGPSGVGKTETAYALADALYGGERNLVAINMSEYQEAHTVSQLKGAPPGYVGYGSGGVLTEAVRRRPYSVVLLDEFEKAHPDVREALYNVFDKGMMEDGTGLLVDFRNTVILATSNAGAELVEEAAAGESPVAVRAVAARLQPLLADIFRPALLARVAVTPYLPLRIEGIRRIAKLKLEKVAARVLAADPDFPGFDDSTVDWVVAQCSASGAREIDRVIMDELVVGLADDILGAAPL
ncbi:type VI secretion system ATPase TssH [Massilia sp. YIM B02769]|uniref:type VI secretion system ATPase TssH n=1 Tax=Massilia sp. YIM B02769 TaxID=3050129 RepID=UPI0025B659CC|nr:type VI secretion system ATPase TssH [Massilia sp. YIM B02769]MDN4059148.1 type VI secretion system ATPase TssH [Massilia sp. YIM B02769]